MEVGLRDTVEQFVEARRPRGRWFQEQAALDESHLDRRIVLEAGFLRERLGNPDGETVAPPLDLGLHGNLLAAVSTMSLPFSEGGAEYITE
jgi:hypothetical protein